MVNFYERVVKTLTRPPERRWNSDLMQIEPWFRKKSALFQAANISRDTIMDVIKHCVFRTLKKHEIVVLQGQRGDDFFILLRGKVSVLIKEATADDDDDEEPVKSEGICTEEERAQLGYQVGLMGDGTAFGEQALINEDCIRTASIVTEEDSDLIVINRELYNRSISDVVQQEYQTKLEYVNESQLFRFWPNKWRKSLALALNREVRAYDEVLVKQGDKADFLYFIMSGGVKVSVEPNEHKEQFKVFIQKCSLMFEDEEKAGIVGKYFTLSKWVSSKSRAADRLKQRVQVDEDDGVVASALLPEFKVNLSPSDIRKQNAIARNKTQKINVCLLETGQLCGDVEFLLYLPKYHSTAVCQMQTIVFSLHRVVFERLFRKKNPSTVPLMTKNIGIQISTRFSRHGLTENIPLLSYISMMVEHLNGERAARRKVRSDGGLVVVDNAVTRPKSLPGTYTYQMPRGHDDSSTKSNWKDLMAKSKEKESDNSKFSMDGIYFKLMQISEPGFQLEGSGMTEEEHSYLVQLKKRLAKHLGAVHPLFKKQAKALKPSVRGSGLPSMSRSSKATPFKTSMKKEPVGSNAILPRRNVMLHLPKV